jgi:hypothetical protein
MKTEPKKPEIDLPKIDAATLKRADETMRRMLNTPPAPFTPKKKSAKKPSK